MKTYQVEELTLNEARTLSGVLFHFTDKHTAVSEDGLITLLTNSEEGFSHVLHSDSHFIYREEESEVPDTTEVIWVCGLINQEGDVLMLKQGNNETSFTDHILITYLTRLVNLEQQVFRFVIGDDTWEISMSPNRWGNMFVLRRKETTFSKIPCYSDEIRYENFTHMKGIWPVIEKFKDHLNKHYKIT